MKKLLISAIAATFLFTTSDAHAVLKVVKPYVTKGKIGAKYYGQVSIGEGSDAGAREGLYSFGYGVTDYWEAELEFVTKDPNGGTNDITAYEFVNKFQLTEKGEYYIDLGVYTAYEVHTDRNKADKAEVYFLFSKLYNKWSHIANLQFKQEVFEDSKKGLELTLGWQTMYKLNDDWKAGFEYFGVLGQLEDVTGYNDQEHLFGPVASYAIPGTGLELKAGLLGGISRKAPNALAKWVIGYKF